jgi:opacity protein-like surface antigen
MLTDRIKFTADAAYLPYVNLSGFDNHWFRADINPETDTGWGWGTQIEGVLSYAITDRWNVGIGGRYWYFTASNSVTEFPGSVPQPSKFNAERYGGFVQTSYKFDGSDVIEPRPTATGLPLAANWTGLYAGAHAGGGWGTNDWNSATGVLGLSGTLFPGSADVNGLLGGGQVGYNYQTGAWVFGLQADASLSNLNGTAKCATFAGPAGPISGTCNNDVTDFGTITGRVGESVGKFLLYADAGAAWAHDKSSVTSFTVGPLSSFGSDTRWGWTLGGGIAYALTANWSLFAEYDYLSLGSKGETLNDAVFGQSVVNIEEKLHVMKVGANYKL